MRRLPYPDFILLLFVLAGLSSGTASAQVSLRFLSPESTLVRADFPLTVEINSSRQLDSVQAELGGQRFPMPAQPQSSTTLSIAGLDYGDHPLTVTVRDVTGAETKFSRTLRVDRPARIVVQSPLNGTVARPSVRLQVSCEDDGPQGCQIRMRTAVEDPRDTARPRPRAWVADENARGHLDHELCLSEYVGKHVFLELSADDGHGAGETVTRLVPVDDSARLTPVVSVPGVVLDFDAQRLLFADEERAFVLDRATGDIQAITEGRADVKSGQLSYDTGHLAPEGAVLFRNEFLHRARNGKFTFVARTSRTSSPYRSPDCKYQIAGSFLYYCDVDRYGPFLHNLATGSEVVPNQSSVVQRALAADGSLLTDTNFTVYVQREKQSSVFARLEWYTADLVWDGTDALFNFGKDTVLLRGGKRYTLADVSLIPLKNVRGLLSQGWVAFSRLGGGVAQVWLYSPEGVETQVSSSGKHSLPVLLAPNGTLIYETDNRYHLAVLGAPPVSFSRAIATRLLLDQGVVYVALGQTLFQMDPTAAEEPLSCPAGSRPPGSSSTPAPGCGCTAAGDESAWLLVLIFMGLGIRHARRVRLR